jgi:hypothetical protein
MAHTSCLPPSRDGDVVFVSFGITPAVGATTFTITDKASTELFNHVREAAPTNSEWTPRHFASRRKLKTSILIAGVPENTAGSANSSELREGLQGESLLHGFLLVRGHVAVDGDLQRDIALLKHETGVARAHGCVVGIVADAGG